jgi:hypothetical protein
MGTNINLVLTLITETGVVGKPILQAKWSGERIDRTLKTI